MTFNLASILRESALAKPDKPCCRFGSDAWSFAELDARSDRIAAGLRDLGLVPGDTVVIQLPNLPEFLEAYFGILKAGLVAVPMNPLLTVREISHQLADSQARAYVTYEACAGAALAAVGAVGDIPVYVVPGPGAAGAPPGTRAFDALRASTGVREMAATEADDTAVVMYTSGTTGRPKGAELTHFQLYMNCTVVGDVFGVRDDDVSVAVLPLFHIYGLSGILNVAIRYGSTLSLVPRFDPELVLDAMHAHRATVFAGVPTMLYALERTELGDRDLSRFRIACSGGAAMPEDQMRRFEKKFGVVILEGYGLTESASTATFNASERDRRPLSIGRPIWGVEVRVVDPGGADLPPGPEHVGEILLRGHNVMKGYYRDPEATAQVLRDGWLRTGDLAWRDKDGYLYIVDRLKDLIIRAGYNVYPREVEEVLYAHPAIAEAAVVGRPDERLGQEVVAVVSLRPGAHAEPKEIIAYCRERLAAYKCPREIRIRPELPKSATGKMLKRAVRDL